MTKQESWRRRQVMAACLAITAVTAAAASAFAQTDDPRVHGNTILIFDASGSMRDQVAGGRPPITKIELARRVASRFVTELVRRQSPMSLGVIAFGLQEVKRDLPQYRQLSCNDVAVITKFAPVSANLQRQLLPRIAGFKEYGETPLGLAVETAIAQLGVRGGSIVVVTDMDETCEDNRPEDSACQVLARANRSRASSDKVYIDSIVVTPSSVNAANGRPETPQGVTRLRECAELRATEVSMVADLSNAAAVASDISARIDRLSRLGHDIPVVATPPVPSAPPSLPAPSRSASPATSASDQRTVKIIDSRGRPVASRTFSLHFSNAKSDVSVSTSNGQAMIVLPEGSYSLDISTPGAASQKLDITVGASSTDIVLTSD